MKYDIQNIEKRKARNNRIRKIINFILVILIYNIILVLASFINSAELPAIFGYKAYVISSESMKPNINNGDIIIVKEVKQNEIKNGDIITFYNNGETITHRVVGVEGNGETTYYRTKGDNNNVEDLNKIDYRNVQGKMIMQIPYWGEILGAISNRVILILLIFTIIFIIMYNRRTDIKKRNRREKKKIEDQKEKDN